MRCLRVIEFGLLLWVVREGHWLLPIQGGHVSKQTAPICRQVAGTDLPARDKGYPMMYLPTFGMRWIRMLIMADARKVISAVRSIWTAVVHIPNKPS